MSMEKQRPVVVLDFLGVERNVSERQNEGEVAEQQAAFSKPTSPFPPLENRYFPPVAMSLRTRETSSMALKRIFDQINSTAEPPDSASNKRVSCPQPKDQDEKRGESLAKHTVMANQTLEPSPQRRISDELQENGTEQRSKALCSWNQSQEASKLFTLRNYADAASMGGEDRTECNGRPSQEIGVDKSALNATMFCPMRQGLPSYANRVLSFQIPDWKETSSDPRDGGKHGQFMKNIAESTGFSNYPLTGRSEIAPQSLALSRKRGVDLDLSFRKTQKQDALTILSQQTAFGSPIPLSSFRSDHQDALLAPPQLPTPVIYPVNGLISGIAASSSKAPGRQSTAQLTIFYSGTVNVYDDVPADKANAIMLLAGTGNSWTSPFVSNTTSADEAAPIITSEMVNTSMDLSAATGTGTVRAPQGPHMVPAPTLSVLPPTFPASSIPVISSSASLEIKQAPFSSAEVKQPKNQQPAKRSHIELPHARKASLARFLEKRKDRVQSRASDMVNNKEDTAGIVLEAEQSSPKRCCYSSPSPCPAATIMRCGSPAPSQCVGEDQMSRIHTLTSQRVL